MYVVEELKHNVFVSQAIPSPRKLFARFGFTTRKGGTYSGDDVVTTGSRKLDDINFADGLNEAALKDETPSV